MPPQVFRLFMAGSLIRAEIEAPLSSGKRKLESKTYVMVLD